jgi:hypothetical protein
VAWDLQARAGETNQNNVPNVKLEMRKEREIYELDILTNIN